LIRLSQDVTEAVEHGRTVLVPSRQRSEALRLAYAARALAVGRSVWRTPDVLPLDAWKAREIDRRAAAGESLPRLLTPAEDWYLWRQSAAELTRGLELVARGPLAEALRRASQLAHDFGMQTGRFPGAPGTEGRLLHDVERAVAERMRALGAATAGQMADRLTALGGERGLLLAGFIPLTPNLGGLIGSRRRNGCPTRVRGERDPGEQLSFGWMSGTPEHAKAVLAADTVEELERITEWCRTRIEARPDARLLVIVPGAPEARERLVTLIRQHVDPRGALFADLATCAETPVAALEGGSPLSRAPLVEHALRSLSWLTGGLDFADFSAWLCAPHWAVPEVDRAKLDLFLRERAPLEIDPRTLLGALEAAREPLRAPAQALNETIVRALRELGSGQASPRQWSERFLGTLAALGWPGGRALNNDETQTRTRFTELLDDFGQLAAVAGAIPRETAVQWLSELAGRTPHRGATADALVTVSGQLGDPIVRYDGIWVAGLHADVWPQPVQPDPFLPLAAQIVAGVPAASAGARAAEARAFMAAWSEAADELILSSPLRAEDVQLSPSPLLAQHARPATGLPEPRSVWLPLRVRREGLTETLIDSSGVQWDTARSLPSGTRSVELQNLCPFRAYAELRLGCTELDAPEPGVAPDLRGKLLHTALEELWGVLGGSAGLAAHSQASLLALIGRSVESAATQTLGEPRAHGRPPAEQRECRRAVRLIAALCELERKRIPFTVKETELDRTLQLAGASMRLRIDRLDELPDGGLAILDYKSGRPVPGDWYSDRPSHPQLLAYLAAVGPQTAAMATISVTAREIRFDGVAAAANLLPKVRPVEAQPGEDARAAWSSRQAEWHERIERLAADFVAGRALVDPRPKACEYCHVVSVCRIADESADAVDRNIGDW